MDPLGWPSAVHARASPAGSALPGHGRVLSSTPLAGDHTYTLAYIPCQLAWPMTLSLSCITSCRLAWLTSMPPNRAHTRSGSSAIRPAACASLGPAVPSAAAPLPRSKATGPVTLPLARSKNRTLTVVPSACGYVWVYGWDAAGQHTQPSGSTSFSCLKTPHCICSASCAPSTPPYPAHLHSASPARPSLQLLATGNLSLPTGSWSRQHHPSLPLRLPPH